ncbi:MAG: hypothetical protein WCC60_04585 [Ilumatobacteraceae bacterium]
MTLWVLVAMIVSGDPHIGERDVRVIVAVGVAVLGLFLVTDEWGRRSFLAYSLVVGLLLAALLVSMGRDLLIEEGTTARDKERESLVVRAEEQKKSVADRGPAASTALGRLDRELRKWQNSSTPPALLTEATVVAEALHRGLSMEDLRSVNGAFTEAVFDAGGVLAPETTRLVQLAQAALSTRESLLAAPSSGKLDAAVEAAPEQGSSSTQLYDLRVALAQYIVDATGADADRTALDELRARARPGADRIDLSDALNRGPDAVIEGFWPNNVRTITPGLLGWLVVAALGLTTFAWLAKRNGRRQVGPVNVEVVNDDDFKIALLQNVQEPGAAPGSDTWKSITDLIALPASHAITRVVTAALAILGRGTGYKVALTSTSMPSSDAGAGEHHEVLVRLTYADGTFAGSTRIHNPSKQKAMREAGYWAAGSILGNSGRVPSWASWNAATAPALDAFNSQRATRDELVAALRSSPNSGVILVKVAARYEEQNRSLDAIEMYCRALIAHPRYWIAMYRLGGTVSMLSQHPEVWSSASLERRAAIVRMMEAAADAAVAEVPVDKLRGADPDFAAVALGWYDVVSRATSLRARVGLAFRRSERVAAIPALIHSGRWGDAARVRWLARSASLVTGHPPLRSDLERRAHDRRSWWQLSYNMACADARKHELDSAMNWLDLCLARPGAEQLTKAWATADPDLKALRTMPRFQRFCEQLPEEAR